LASATAATLAGLLAVAHLRDAARKALASILRANQESPRAMEHKNGLLIGPLHGNERHVWTSDGLANGRGIGRVVLAAPDIGL
jgi:hypothetical protein